MRVTSRTGATRVQHNDTVYDADDGGIFEVPQEVGDELTAFPDWLPEHVAAAHAAAEQAERDTDARRLADRLAAVEARLDELEAKRPARSRKSDADPE